MINRHVIIASLVALCVAPGPWLAAQASDPPPPESEAGQAADVETPAERSSPLSFSLAFSEVRQFDTDLDAGGEVDATRFGASGRASLRFDPRASIAFSLMYSRDDYDFTGAGEFASLDPWEEINTLRGGARLTYSLDERWVVWGGPLVERSAESGADESAVTWGGIIGASARLSETLSLGAGVGVMSQIEDGASLFPIIILDWRFAEDWALRTIGDTGSMRGGGVELAWEFAEDWEVCGGAWYESRRFRLDGEGAAPDGVGEETLLPVFVRLRYSPVPSFSAELLAGAGFGGEMRLEDDDGDRVADDDLAAAPFIGARLSVQF